MSLSRIQRKALMTAYTWEYYLIEDSHPDAEGYHANTIRSLVRRGLIKEKEGEYVTTEAGAEALGARYEEEPETLLEAVEIALERFCMDVLDENWEIEVVEEEIRVPYYDGRTADYSDALLFINGADDRDKLPWEVVTQMLQDAGFPVYVRALDGYAGVWAE